MNWKLGNHVFEFEDKSTLYEKLSEDWSPFEAFLIECTD